MIVRDASDADIEAVCAGMRASDRREQFAARWSDDPADLASELVAQRPVAIAHKCLAADDGTPVALIGAWLAGPGLAVLHQVATDRWPEIGRRAHRFYRRWFIPFVLRPNVRRAECRVVADDLRTRRWLQAHGFSEEGLARRFGKAGEDFVHMAWLNPYGREIGADVHPRTAEALPHP